MPKRETATNIFAHNATTLRNLAEILHRENVPPVETQYRSQPPMVMRPVTPEPLLAGHGQLNADIKGKGKVPTSPNSAMPEGHGNQLQTGSAAYPGKTDLAAADKSKGIFSGWFSPKPKDNDMTKEHQVNIGEGAMSADAKRKALQQYQDILAAGGSDPLKMLMTVDNFGALDAIKELPPARAHSISQDRVVISKPGARTDHELSSDTIISSGKTAPVAAHELVHDRVINVEPPKHGTHRLSADALVPVRVAAPVRVATPIHADPAVAAPKHLFPHEILDFRRALHSKSPQPHGLHGNTVLAAPQPRSAHDIHSDLLVKAAHATRSEQDLAHDVRILSPSGAVRDPHSMSDDEIIKQNAVFRKSPHPDAMMPGQWPASTPSGTSVVNNPMASLNSSLHTAGQALNQLNHTRGTSSDGKENTTGMSILTHPLRLCPPLDLYHSFR